MTIFRQLANASSTEGRYPWISLQGVTVDSILRIRTGKTREGVPYFAVDLEVQEVLGEQPLSADVLSMNEKIGDPTRKAREGVHQPGERVCFSTNLAAPALDSKLGNVKNFIVALCAAMDIDPPETEDEWEEAIVDEEAGFASGDGTLAAGTKLIRSTEWRAKKQGVGVYPVSTWSPVEAAA